MILLASLAGTATFAHDGTPQLFGRIVVSEPTDPFRINLTVDQTAAVAAAQRFRRYGWRVDINGVTQPDRVIGKALTVAENADAYGDSLAVQFVGAKFSPLSRALMRTRARIEVFATFGSIRDEYRTKAFTGNIISAPFDIQPAAANVAALDAAGLYSQRKAKEYSLGPNHGKSRLTVAYELLAIAGIPIRHLDLGGDGGTGRKPFTVGDRPVLDFLRDYLGILGCELGFEDGALVGRRYNPNLPAVAELNPGNLLVPLSLSAPDTVTPNATGVVSTSFTRTEVGGVRGPVVTSVVTVGDYAPLTYATLQNGTFTAANPAGPGAPSPRIISEVETAVSYLGSLDVRTEESESAWYAPRAAGTQITTDEDPPGYVVGPRIGALVYIYPDGSTRATPEERFGVTRKMIRTKDVDADGNVIHQREDRYGHKMLRRALWLTNSEGEDVLQGGGYSPVDDEGNGTLGDDALRLTESADTTWTLNTDGTIAEEKLFEAFFSIGLERRRSLGARGWGIETRIYTSLAEERMATSEGEIGTANAGGWRLTTRRYRALDEDRYEATETVRTSDGTPRVTTSRITGALPRPERVEAEQSSQEVRATVTDATRVAMVGESIEDVEHNEFVETAEEARVYAAHRARLAGAIVLTCETPIEALIHKFRMVRVNIPGASIHGQKFYVRSVTRDAATFREAIVAHLYPASLT